MPKLKPSDTELQNCRTRAAIRHNMELYGITEDDLAKRFGKTRETIQNKFKNPETFTFSELRILSRMLKMSDEQKAEMIGV